MQNWSEPYEFGIKLYTAAASNNKQQQQRMTDDGWKEESRLSEKGDLECSFQIDGVIRI